MTLLIAAHITIALLTLASSVFGIVRGEQAKNLLSSLSLLLGLTILSGATLAIATPASILSVCDNLAIYSLISIGAMYRIGGMQSISLRNLVPLTPGITLVISGLFLGL